MGTSCLSTHLSGSLSQLRHSKILEVNTEGVERLNSILGNIKSNNRVIDDLSALGEIDDENDMCSLGSFRSAYLESFGLQPSR